MKAATILRSGVGELGKISIHAAREGGDWIRNVKIVDLWAFQSTPPVKAATVSEKKDTSGLPISIHAAREGGDSAARPQSRAQAISIHAAREGGDVAKGKVIACPVEFQSTPPVKAATPCVLDGNLSFLISIHAAREGGDAAQY